MAANAEKTVASWRKPNGILARFAVLSILAASAMVWADAWIARQPLLQFGTWLHTLSIRLTDLGRAEPYYLIFCFGLAFSWWRRRASLAAEFWSRWFAILTGGLAGLVATGLFTQLAKHVIGRARPYAEAALTGHAFSPLTTNYEFHSLPSGHAQVLFSFAAFLCALIQERLILSDKVTNAARSILPIVIVTAAAVLTSTRVFTLNHWLSDVILGATLGFVGSRWAIDKVGRSVYAKLSAVDSEKNNSGAAAQAQL